MDAPTLVELPAQGRVYRSARRVRLGDVTPDARVRFDAVARYLQDIARDDSADAALENPMGWVVRRNTIRVEQWPVFQEQLALATWCSGIGSRWAERRTSLVGEHGGAVEAATVWVHVDAKSGRPMRLVDGFTGLYGASAGGRAAEARLALPAEVPDEATATPWPLRRSDFDVLDHVNNAAHWVALEELLDPHTRPATPATAVVEHRQAIAATDAVRLCSERSSVGSPFAWWLSTEAGVATAGWFDAAGG